MKKLSYKTIILAAACLLLPGCSDDAADKALVSPDMLVADSEVEIKLSSGSPTMATRAGVYEDGEGGFYTSKWMGIFCLADGKLIDDAPDIDWSRTATASNDVVLSNAGAMARGNELAFTGSKVYYYPVSNYYKYTFYGYHLAQGNDVVEYTADKITVPITFNGYDDILWGKSDSPNGEDIYRGEAYSARYYRQHTKDGTTAKTPNLGFKHVMTCLEFAVEGMDDDANTLSITSVELLNTPKNLHLVIADKEGNQGKVVKDENSTETVDVALRDHLSVFENGNWTTTAPVMGTVSVPTKGEKVDIGVSDTDKSPAAFFAFPQKNHEIRVKMKNSSSSFTYDMNVSLPDETNGYAGHKYKIILQVYGPQEIKLTTTLTPWEYDKTGGTDDIVIEL